MKKVLLLVTIMAISQCYAQVKSTMLYRAPYKEKSHAFSNILGYIEKDSIVEVLDVYPDNYLQIRYKDTVAYLLNFHLKQDSELLNFMDEKSKGLPAKIASAKKQEDKIQEDELIKLTKIYGNWASFVQDKGPVVRTMPDKVVLAILGRPNDINETVGSWGRHEQWVYNKAGGAMHLYYFENGILTSWQR